MRTVLTRQLSITYFSNKIFFLLANLREDTNKKSSLKNATRYLWKHLTTQKKNKKIPLQVKNETSDNVKTCTLAQLMIYGSPGTSKEERMGLILVLVFFFFSRKIFASFYLGFTLFLGPLGSCPGRDTSQLTFIFWGKWSATFRAVKGGVKSEVVRYGLTLAPASLTLYMLMQCEVARLNSLSNFFDVSKSTDGIHFHTVQKT